MIGGHLLHGGDYNPEQWIEYPEILEEDLKLMNKANVNCVTLGVFSWAELEPKEDVYTFEWLEEIIDKLRERKIQVVLATPSGGMPHWLTQKYPETLQVQADGTVNLPGKRHNFCYSSPVMRRKVKQIDRALAQRFGKKENVILWHISNEFGGNFKDSTCHCEKCQKKFREWLKNKYGTLDKLNASWWTGFWSHKYTDWDQIHSPSPQGECLTTALTLDWKRFSSEQITDFCKMEADALREFSDLPTTTNMMGFFKGVDYNTLKNAVDIISWDNYPFWHERKDEVPEAVYTSAGNALMRSLKREPFLLMESTPSSVSWRSHNPLKRPGMHMLSSMQAVAHGADSVQYFQWRKSRGGYEKFHGAVVDHKNGSDTRTFREVTEVGKRLEHLSGGIKTFLNRAKAAIVFDWENWWAVEDTSGPRQDLDYVKCVTDHYRAFWECGLDVDFVSMDDDFSGYRLLAAPLNYMYKKGYSEKVRAFVEAGGTYVTTYFSGIVNETDLCFIGWHPLEDVLGVVSEEMDAPSKEFENCFDYNGKEYPAYTMCDIVHAKAKTEIYSVYKKDFYKGCPVVTENAYGSGRAYYLSAESDQRFLSAFYKDVFIKAGLLKEASSADRILKRLPHGVTAAKREDETGRKGLVFVMNFNDRQVRLEGIGKQIDAESGEVYENVLEMAPFSCTILKLK